MKTKTMRDSYEKMYEEFNGAWLTSTEIQNLRCSKNRWWSDTWFITGDGGVFHKNESGDIIFYITRQPLNPILKLENYVEAFSQLRAVGHYKMEASDLQAIIDVAKKNDGDVTSIEISKLRLNKYNGYEFSTRGPCIPGNFPYKIFPYKKQLNAEELKLAEAYHGSGEQFDSVMKMLTSNAIRSGCAYGLRWDDDIRWKCYTTQISLPYDLDKLKTDEPVAYLTTICPCISFRKYNSSVTFNDGLSSVEGNASVAGYRDGD